MLIAHIRIIFFLSLDNTKTAKRLIGIEKDSDKDLTLDYILIIKDQLLKQPKRQKKKNPKSLKKKDTKTLIHKQTSWVSTQLRPGCQSIT